MKTKQFFLIILVVTFTLNCDRKTTPNKTIYVDYYDEDIIQEKDSIIEGPIQDQIQLTGNIVTCNKCGGYGMVQDGLYGQTQICKFCWVSTWMRIQQGWKGFNGRYGQVDAVFNNLPVDYFDGLEMNSIDETESNDNIFGLNREQIEAEIERREEYIANMENDLEYIDGGVTRSIINQKIIEEKYEIKRLKQMLNN